jgi:hypothetical protein
MGCTDDTRSFCPVRWSHVWLRRVVEEFILHVGGSIGYFQVRQQQHQVVCRTHLKALGSAVQS